MHILLQTQQIPENTIFYLFIYLFLNLKPGRNLTLAFREFICSQSKKKKHIIIMKYICDLVPRSIRHLRLCVVYWISFVLFTLLNGLVPLCKAAIV